MLRKRGARVVARRRGVYPAAVGTGRWHALCRSAESGRAGPVDALLGELMAVRDGGTAEDRKVALDELLRSAPRLWTALDRRTRAGHPPGARPPLPPNAGPLHLVLASFDSDGHLRQAAVERLAGRGGGDAAAALALRTGDWVPAVRERARTALLSHLAPDEASEAVRMLSRLGARSRCAGVLDEYRAALREPERRRTVRRLAAESDPRVRRFGMGLALELGEYVRGDLARAALHDRDAECRRMCAEELLRLDPDQAGRLMWARSAAVRELAVAALPDDVPAARLVGPLADRARTVRAQARWKLWRRGEPPVEVYRRQLRRCGRTTHPRVLAGLAAGLGECGDLSDLSLLAVLVRDAGRPAVVRRAAVRATARLAAYGTQRGTDPDATLPDGVRQAAGTLEERVADPVPSVAREALDGLALLRAATLPVLERALRRPEREVWRAVLRAGRAVGYLDRAELLLAASADPRPEVSDRAGELLREWNRLARPGGAIEPGRAARIRDVLRRAAPPEDVRRVLEALLRSPAP